MCNFTFLLTKHENIMSFPFSTIACITEAGDSLMTNGSRAIQILQASTNQYDEAINRDICLTIAFVAVLVCIAVCVSIFIATKNARDIKLKEIDAETRKLKQKEDHILYLRDKAVAEAVSKEREKNNRDKEG